jgi:hypothetical protein
MLIAAAALWRQGQVWHEVGTQHVQLSNGVSRGNGNRSITRQPSTA